MDFLNLLKPKVHPSKNGFDLSRKHVFSSKAGQLKPCLAVETVPGDNFEIDVTSLTRTMTLNTAAFLRGKQRYDFFFVPYSQLWHPFNQFISQRTDKHSMTQNGHLYCPVIELQALLDWIADCWFDGANNLYNRDVHGYDSICGMLDLLNLLGYGDFYYIIHAADVNTAKQDNAEYAGKYVNLFRLAAFQHIWYDYYRNKYYDVDATGGIYASQMNVFSNVDMFNFDDVLCNSFATSILSPGLYNTSDPASYRIMRLLQPRYVQYKKDLFTSALPGQQFGAVSSVNLGSVVSQSDIDRWVKGVSSGTNPDPGLEVRTSVDYYLRSLQQIDPNDSSLKAYLTHTHIVPGSSFDVLTLRKAEMLQVWKQRTLRAGNMVDDSFEAHYGVKPYYEDENNVNYLGSFSSALQINTVEATANAGQSLNGKVGDIAATGTCVVGGNKIKFNPKDFGIIMCCASFLPESEYNATSIEKANTLHEQFDFFTPEFENIGLEAIPYREYDFRAQDASHSESVVGYAPRYWMYKEGRDKCFGQFMSSGSLRAWVAPRQIYNTFTPQGAFVNDMSNMYVKPAIMNNIFAIVANGDNLTDTFLNNVYFDIKAIRPMSELGLPQF